MDCKKAQNIKKCTCTYTGCPRKGICCKCIQHHIAKNQLPACCFPPEIEKEYDRSFERFIESRK